MDLIFATTTQPKVRKITESQTQSRPSATPMLDDGSKSFDLARQILPSESSNSQSKITSEVNRNVEENAAEHHSIDPCDPDRKICHMYYLVHRKDKKNCPTKVSRCNSCKLKFQIHDVVVVCTQGTREWTDKDGTKKSSSGNIYLHYLSKCLEGNDGEFKFTNIIILKETLKLLPDSALERF